MKTYEFILTYRAKTAFPEGELKDFISAISSALQAEFYGKFKCEERKEADEKKSTKNTDEKTEKERRREK